VTLFAASQTAQVAQIRAVPPEVGAASIGYMLASGDSSTGAIAA